MLVVFERYSCGQGNATQDQRICFRYIDSIFPLLLKIEISSTVIVHPVCVGPGRMPSAKKGFSHDTDLILAWQLLLMKVQRQYSNWKKGLTGIAYLEKCMSPTPRCSKMTINQPKRPHTFLRRPLRLNQHVHVYGYIRS